MKKNIQMAALAQKDHVYQCSCKTRKKLLLHFKGEADNIRHKKQSVRSPQRMLRHKTIREAATTQKTICEVAPEAVTTQNDP